MPELPSLPGLPPNILEYFPLEIIREILKNLVHTTSDTLTLTRIYHPTLLCYVTFPVNSSGVVGATPLNLDFLRTCKLFKKEGTNLIWANNFLYLRTLHWDRDQPNFRLRFFDLAAPSMFTSVRKLSLFINIWNFEPFGIRNNVDRPRSQYTPMDLEMMAAVFPNLQAITLTPKDKLCDLTPHERLYVIIRSRQARTPCWTESLRALRSVSRGQLRSVTKKIIISTGRPSFQIVQGAYLGRHIGMDVDQPNAVIKDLGDAFGGEVWVDDCLCYEKDQLLDHAGIPQQVEAFHRTTACYEFAMLPRHLDRVPDRPSNPFYALRQVQIFGYFKECVAWMKAEFICKILGLNDLEGVLGLLLAQNAEYFGWPISFDFEAQLPEILLQGGDIRLIWAEAAQLVKAMMAFADVSLQIEERA